MVTALDDKNFDQFLNDNDKPVLIDFWGENCGACKMLEPILDRLSAQDDARFTAVKVKVDDHPDLAARYNVRGLPTLILMSDGKALGSKTGAMPESILSSWINQLLNTERA